MTLHKSRLPRSRHALSLTLTLAVAVTASASGQPRTNSAPAGTVAPLPQRILVKAKKGQSLAALHQSTGGHVAARFPAIGNLEIVDVPNGISSQAFLKEYRGSGLIQYAESDHVVHALLEPNDFNYFNGDCWHLKNNGQYGGVVGADIHATEAWDIITSAPGIIVAVLDSGVRYTHEDLAPNLWHNPEEIAGNGLDDDGDGYVDDVYGINVVANNGDPWDDFGHGSHVAGILGAAGNNTVGVAGVCWQVQIMACKFLNSMGMGLVSDAIKCIDYARSKGAKIINLSWGDPAYNSQALYDAIASARAAGIIVTCACGNSDSDNDSNPLYPASFNLDNIISVAATTRQDQRASFSSYGLTTVDLGAPGDPVFSCWNTSDNAYQGLAGTSMAAPMVAGACALVWALYPSETYNQIISRVLSGTDPLADLAGKCVTGGRLNVKKALGTPPPAIVETATFSPPSSIVIHWSSVVGGSYKVLGTTDLSSGSWQDMSGVITASGTDTWWNASVAGAPSRFYRIWRVN